MEYPVATVLPSNSPIACVSSAIRARVSFILSCLLLVPEPMQLFPGHGEIVEEKNAFASGLSLLVSFTGNQHDVPGLCLSEGLRDCLSPVRLEDIGRTRPLQTQQSIIHDRQRIFTPWIIRGEYHKITAIAGSLAHQRTLGPVAIAAASEDRDHLAAG